MHADTPDCLRPAAPEAPAPQLIVALDSHDIGFVADDSETAGVAVDHRQVVIFTCQHLCKMAADFTCTCYNNVHNLFAYKGQEFRPGLF